MAKNDNYYADKKSLLEEQRELEKKIAKMKIPCSHTSNKGKVKVDFEANGLGKCKICGTKFRFDIIDLNDLDKAIMIVHNAINQVKVFSDDPNRERKVIIKLGELDYNLSELRELYKRASKDLGNGKKKKNKSHDDQFGSYGTGNIGFVGGGKKKGKYYR